MNVLVPKEFEPVGFGERQCTWGVLRRSCSALPVPGGFLVTVLDSVSTPPRTLAVGPAPLISMMFFMPVDSLDAVREALFDEEEK